MKSISFEYGNNELDIAATMRGVCFFVLYEPIPEKYLKLHAHM